MKTYPVNFKYRTEFDLMPSWVPQALQDWFDQGLTQDITVRRITSVFSGTSSVKVVMTASTSEDLTAKRKAFNSMIEAMGYGPGANKK